MTFEVECLLQALMNTIGETKVVHVFFFFPKHQIERKRLIKLCHDEGILFSLVSILF